jgi:hypothetical protein
MILKKTLFVMHRHLLVQLIKHVSHFKIYRKMAPRCQIISVLECRKENQYMAGCYRNNRQMELSCQTLSRWHGCIDSRKQL